MNTMKYLLFALLLTVVGCADDGAPGPKGDKGDAGEKGLTGDTGTANVIYSDWFALNTATDKFTTYKNASTNRLVYEIDAPDITQEIADEGLILVFFRDHELTYPFPVSSYSSIIMELRGFGISKLFISIYEEGYPAVERTQLIEESAPLFRYIIVPGGNPVSSSARTVYPVDYKDYEALKFYYNIPD